MTVGDDWNWQTTARPDLVGPGGQIRPIPLQAWSAQLERSESPAAPLAARYDNVGLHHRDEPPDGHRPGPASPGTNTDRRGTSEHRHPGALGVVRDAVAPAVPRRCRRGTAGIAATCSGHCGRQRSTSTTGSGRTPCRCLDSSAPGRRTGRVHWPRVSGCWWRRVRRPSANRATAALDTLVREELGPDLDRLGSRWAMSVTSALPFAAVGIGIGTPLGVSVSRSNPGAARPRELTKKLRRMVEPMHCALRVDRPRKLGHASSS